MSGFFFIISGFWLIVVDYTFKELCGFNDLKPPLTGDFKSLDVALSKNGNTWSYDNG
jgi:hypothetical protein